MLSVETLIEQFGIMESVTATQKDTQKDSAVKNNSTTRKEYVVRVRGKKVNITYESSDEELCRNFLAHVVKTTILEDITISIKGPEKIEYTCNVTFNTVNTGDRIVWTDTSAGGIGGIVDI